MNAKTKTLYVRPKDGGYEVRPADHRRGPRFATELEAIGHAAGQADEIFVLNRTGKVVVRWIAD